jgi:16S rRNA (cytosine967-C5)-methyltransferase
VAPTSARGAAFTALRAWRKESRRADSIISKLLSERRLSASDRAFALELFYGVLRNLTLLDFWTSCLRTSRIDSDLRDILRLGLYQLLLLKVPEHAAVYESVELAPRQSRGFINGMLRTAVRRREMLLVKASSQPLSIRTSHPEFLITRWRKNFGADATAALCGWNNRPPHVYARINRLTIGDEEFARRYPNAQRISNNSNFVEFSTFPNEALERGHCYIQDPSTAIACELLNPQPGEKILDACAAPGGKTGYLAERMQNRGIIVASDAQPGRAGVLAENMIRLGVKAARVVCHDWKRGDIPKEIAAIGVFDRILIDAPCTNTGVMRRRVDVKWRVRPVDFARMQKQQIEIARSVCGLLKPAGVLVYSTCSLEPDENEQVVEQLLIEFPRLRLTEKRDSRPFRDKIDGTFAARLVSGKAH